MSESSSPLSITLHDIASLVNKHVDKTTNPTPLLRPGLLFYTRSVEQANDEDNRILREDLRIRTTINTRHPEKLLYYHNDTTGIKDAQTLRIDNVLGITSCQVHLRLGSFVKSLVNELPLMSRLKFERKANATTNRKDPKVQEYIRNFLPARSGVDNGLAVLQAAASVIAYVFNHVLSASRAFPVLVSGDVPLRDSTLMFFMLLLLLDIPETIIEHVLLEIGEELSNTKLYYTGAVDQREVPRQEKVDQTCWTRGLKQRLHAKYGGIAGYLRSAGVTEAAMKAIRDWLLPALSEKSGSLIDLES